uniref:Uncharacterized protein n=1 Tax=Mus musculus TaxID=10090 RepID=Q3UY76_MOUSE|nr:unnamed protein product [Mus musculus]
MSVQVVSAAAAAKVPEVELKDLSPSEAEPQLGLSAAAVGAMVPPAGGGDPEAPAPAPAAERPPAPGPGSGPTAALSPAAGKVPQASAMKRSDPHHQHQRQRDGGEALVSPDGTVTEAPRTVKKMKRNKTPVAVPEELHLRSSTQAGPDLDIQILNIKLMP